MNKAIPKIKEQEEDLRQLLKIETDRRKHWRVQSLFLIVSKQAASRKKVAQILGVNRA